MTTTRILRALACAVALTACGQPATVAGKGEPSQEDAAAAPNATSRNGFEIATVRIDYSVQGPGSARGTMTIWIEDYGARAAQRVEEASDTAAPVRIDTYWNGSRSFVRRGNLPVASAPFRPVTTDASAMARSSEAERAATGWTAQGTRAVAGQTCNVWRNERMGGIELCVWRGLELQEISGVQRREATAIVEGEGVPAEITGLAD